MQNYAIYGSESADRVIVLALALGLAGCGATSHHDRSHTTGRAAHAAQQDRRDRHTATGPYTPLGPAQHGAGGDVEDDEPHASRTQVSDARSVARAFFTTYVAFLYGRLPASARSRRRSEPPPSSSSRDTPPQRQPNAPPGPGSNTSPSPPQARPSAWSPSPS